MELKDELCPGRRSAKALRSRGSGGEDRKEAEAVHPRINVRQTAGCTFFLLGERSVPRNPGPACRVEGGEMYLQQQRPTYQPPGFGAVSTAGLLGQVLGITGVGFIFTAIAAYMFRGVSPGVGLFAMIAGFILLFVMQAARRNQQTALLLFYAFTFLWGIGLAPTITSYITRIGPDVVVDAAATTALGMTCLGLIAYTFSFDWRRLSSIAFGALIALVIVGLVSIFFHFIQPATYDWLVLGVFTLLTLVDFARIRAGGDGYTAVDLAISIYLDAINIFVALLQLIGMRRSDD